MGCLRTAQRSGLQRRRTLDREGSQHDSSLQNRPDLVGAKRRPLQALVRPQPLGEIHEVARRNDRDTAIGMQIEQVLVASDDVCGCSTDSDFQKFVVFRIAAV